MRLDKVKWRPHFIPLVYKDDNGENISKRNNKRIFVQNAVDFLSRLNIARFGKTNISPPKSRRVKSYGLYKLLKIDSKIFKIYRRAKLKDFKTHYNIDETNKVVGWTPDYVGITKSKKIKTFNYISKWTKQILPSISDKVDKSFIIDMFNSTKDDRVVYSGGFDTVHDHLKEYFKNNSTDYTIEELIKIISFGKYKWFETSEVSFRDSSELWNLVRTNLSAYSGHYCNKIFGMRKGDCDYESRSVAEKLYKILKNRPLKNMYLWNVLGREKDIKVSDNDGEVGTRAILCCEYPATVLLMWFAQKISLYLGHSESTDKSFNILGEHTGYKSNKIFNKDEYYDWKLEADWKYYDSNIDTNFLILAGLIITNGLPTDRLHKNIRYYIIKSIVTKYVVLPPGCVVELNRANASGHPFTTLVNCTVNLIYWSLIGYKIYGENYADYMSVEVYGDDTIAHFKSHRNLSKIDQYIEECGLKSESLLNNFRPCKIPCDSNHDIDFLKRRIKPYGMVWNHKKMFDKLFYQSKNRDIDTQVNLLYSYYETCKLDDNVISYVTEIFKNIKINGDYELLQEHETKTLVNDHLEKYYSHKECLPDDDKYYSHYQPTNTINNISKYFKIYDWCVYKHDLERIYEDSLKNNNNDASNLLFYLSLSNSELNSFGKDIKSDVGRSPPDEMNKFYRRRIDEYFVLVKTEITSYLKRVKRRL